jgi:hypothetical protein
MHRIDGPGATVDNHFTEGDPVGAVQATIVTDDWLNAVQEEIVAVITDPLVTPAIPLNKAANNQLITAIKRLITSGYSQATELAAGLAKVATQALTNAGVDDTTIVTPKKLRFGFSILLAANGYIVLPSWLGGFIFQWFAGANISAAANSSTQQVATFPIQFPNAVLGGGVWAKYVSGISPSMSEHVAPTTTQVTVILINSFTANTSTAAPRGFYFGY